MKEINIAYDGADDPSFPRRYVRDSREYTYFSQDSNSQPTMKFLFKKWSDLKDEFPLIDPGKVHVECYDIGDSYDGGSVEFSFERAQTDQEYAKSLYYHRQSEERKAKRDADKAKKAAEKVLSAAEKAVATEAKERAEYERLKKKYEG